MIADVLIVTLSQGLYAAILHDLHGRDGWVSSHSPLRALTVVASVGDSRVAVASLVDAAAPERVVDFTREIVACGPSTVIFADALVPSAVSARLRPDDLIVVGGSSADDAAWRVSGVAYPSHKLAWRRLLHAAAEPPRRRAQGNVSFERPSGADRVDARTPAPEADRESAPAPLVEVYFDGTRSGIWAALQVSLGDSLVALVGADDHPQPVARHVVDCALELAAFRRSGGGKGDKSARRIDSAPRVLDRMQTLIAASDHFVATSLDVLASYWLDRDLEPQVLRLMETQPRGRSSGRLFAFSTPASLQNHARFLDVHASYLENTFVCARATYEHIVKSETVPRELALVWPAADAAILAVVEHDGQSLVVKQGAATDVAASVASLQTAFEAMADVEPGHRDTTTQVLRWRQGQWRDTAAWATQVEGLFERRSADVLHMVVFHISSEEYARLRAILVDIAHRRTTVDGRTATMAERHGVRNLWLAEWLPRETHPLHDATTGVALNYARQTTMPYVLVMRFDDADSLSRFMADEDHLRLRLSVFQCFDSPLRHVMKDHGIVTTADLTREAATRNGIYQSLESLAIQRMRREDFVTDDLASEVVRFPPIPFPAADRPSLR